MNNKPEIDPELDLVLERIVDVRPELLWKAWTEPEHLKQWFTPKPWETIECEIDLRPGGIFSTTMRSPEGEVMPANPGCYLETLEHRKLVFTDSLGPGFRPKSNPFMTAMILSNRKVMARGTPPSPCMWTRRVENSTKRWDSWRVGGMLSTSL